MCCCTNNGTHQLAVDTNAEISVLDDQSRPKLLFRNLTPTHVLKFRKHDSPVDADSHWMLQQIVFPKIPIVRAALETIWVLTYRY